ncbi:MAG: hypothetical protein LBT37_05090 [Lactobacillaceae bacterium]|jgi:competence protein CoiA|nr:hypothetical protein [Lactobacillaceae bacterium]
MLIAINQENKLIQADDAKRGIPYFCPSCRQAVTVRQGEIKIKHYAHRDLTECDTLAEGESVEHLQGKIQLRDYFEQQGYTVELETYLPQLKQRPDLLVKKAGRDFVIEYQCAPISINRLKERNVGYASMHLPVLWVLGAPYQQKQLAGATQAKFATLHHGQVMNCFWNTSDPARHLIWVPWIKIDGINRALNKINYQRQLQRQLWQMQQALTCKRPEVRLLQNQMYQMQRTITGIPWYVHNINGLPGGLKGDHWDVKLKIILRLENDSQSFLELLDLVAAEEWCDFGGIQCELVQQMWLQAVLKEWLALKIIKWDEEQFSLAGKLKWYVDYQHKLADLDEFLWILRRAGMLIN